MHGNIPTCGCYCAKSALRTIPTVERGLFARWVGVEWVVRTQYREKHWVLVNGLNLISWLHGKKGSINRWGIVGYGKANYGSNSALHRKGLAYMGANGIRGYPSFKGDKEGFID